MLLGIAQLLPCQENMMTSEKRIHQRKVQRNYQLRKLRVIQGGSNERKERATKLISRDST